MTATRQKGARPRFRQLTDLHILGRDGDRLVVRYHGACGTCPSSISGTLRGIERLLRTIEPDLEVLAA